MAEKSLHTVLSLYDKTWLLALPFLRINRRLKDGFSQRKCGAPLPPADIWIQAASGGEAYLAWTLLENLRMPEATRILVTTNTRQGMDISSRAAARLAESRPELSVFTAWFPFDRPSIMRTAVSHVNPKLAILLESELWPGFMSALKNQNRPFFIINGRMTEKSMTGYRWFPRVCRSLRPDGILAISKDDAKRFESVFGGNGVSVMSNIKFDSLSTAPSDSETASKAGFLKPLLPAGSRFLVLGSVRREEEAEVLQIIQKVHRAHPDIITGLAPRHLNRIPQWENTIDAQGFRWHRRSRIEGAARAGDIILWDVFGELSTIYAAADAVFVGGSLAPLGGQNFLEPLVYGVVPVIGPSYENFAWVGDNIFRKGLVIKAKNHQEVAGCLIRQLEGPPEKSEITLKANAYITARQGGTRTACSLIEKALLFGDRAPEAGHREQP